MMNEELVLLLVGAAVLRLVGAAVLRLVSFAVGYCCRP
jgi:hypothetical protein